MYSYARREPLLALFFVGFFFFLLLCMIAER